MTRFQQMLSGGLTLGIIALAAIFAISEPSKADASALELDLVTLNQVSVDNSSVASDWEFTARSRGDRCRFSGPGRFTGPG